MFSNLLPSLRSQNNCFSEIFFILIIRNSFKKHCVKRLPFIYEAMALLYSVIQLSRDNWKIVFKRTVTVFKTLAGQTVTKKKRNKKIDSVDRTF